MALQLCGRMARKKSPSKPAAAARALITALHWIRRARAFDMSIKGFRYEYKDGNLVFGGVTYVPGC